MNGFIAAAICFSGSASVSAEEARMKVLVLGTESPVLSDVQDRVLRESVMRELLAAGIAIVPVMELEREIQLDAVNVRSVPLSTVPALAERFGARLILRGAYGGKNRAGVYTLIIEDAVEGKRYATDLDLLRGEPFQVYCPGLVKRIVVKTREIAGGLQRGPLQ